MSQQNSVLWHSLRTSPTHNRQHPHNLVAYFGNLESLAFAVDFDIIFARVGGAVSSAGPPGSRRRNLAHVMWDVMLAILSKSNFVNSS